MAGTTLEGEDVLQRAEVGDVAELDVEFLEELAAQCLLTGLSALDPAAGRPIEALVLRRVKALSSRWTKLAGASPATIRQKMQSLTVEPPRSVTRDGARA